MPGSPEITPTCPEPARLRSHISASNRTFAGSVDHRRQAATLRARSNLLSLDATRLHAPGLDRLFHALQRSPAKRRTAERSADQLVSARADHDAVLTGESLAGGPRHVPNCRTLLADRRARRARCRRRPLRCSPRCARPGERSCRPTVGNFCSLIAAAIASEARTARSGSFSCACGTPKYASNPSPIILAIWPP